MPASRHSTKQTQAKQSSLDPEPKEPEPRAVPNKLREFGQARKAGHHEVEEEDVEEDSDDDEVQVSKLDDGYLSEALSSMFSGPATSVLSESDGAAIGEPKTMATRTPTPTWLSPPPSAPCLTVMRAFPYDQAH
ncbi:hypothetical protein NMY22_g12729 [Coprinellus aureogranulatus]|nr:hypothetical protein NMY22_g12729 [Coprinellus aureogranulatus]